ncbi:hypothetical protein GGD56_006969 [Rhizobium mongolense]|uniref:Uncharacterized protein n=1 Tax=Rhizobium mongolense TaxID=57676 RepID=A0ABR6IYR7_9HYPH|nr:hypothetical protein [Rhizobium mongolense]
MRGNSAQKHPFSQPLQPHGSIMSQAGSARQQRSPDLDRADLFPIKPSQKRHQLRMVKTHPRRRYTRPAEALIFKGFRIEADPAAVLLDDANTVRPLRPEHVKRAIERVETAIPHQRHQRRGSLAEVDRLARHLNHNTGSDHALRTTRRIWAR